MVVYRLEYNGKGPYRYYEIRSEMSLRYLDITADMFDAHKEDVENHPLPEDDGIFIDSPRYLFGCISRESLEEWFGEFFQPLIEVGFKVVEYNTEQVLVGRKQVAFIPA